MLAELIRRHRPGFTLEQPFYTDESIFRLDVNAIYRRHWLLAGPTCRVREPGDFKFENLTVGGNSVLDAKLFLTNEFADQLHFAMSASEVGATDAPELQTPAHPSSTK